MFKLFLAILMNNAIINMQEKRPGSHENPQFLSINPVLSLPMGTEKMYMLCDILAPALPIKLAIFSIVSCDIRQSIQPIIDILDKPTHTFSNL